MCAFCTLRTLHTLRRPTSEPDGTKSHSPLPYAELGMMRPACTLPSMRSTTSTRRLTTGGSTMPRSSPGWPASVFKPFRGQVNSLYLLTHFTPTKSLCLSVMWTGASAGTLFSFSESNPDERHWALRDALYIFVHEAVDKFVDAVSRAAECSPVGSEICAVADYFVQARTKLESLGMAEPLFGNRGLWCAGASSLGQVARVHRDLDDIVMCLLGVFSDAPYPFTWGDHWVSLDRNTFVLFDARFPHGVAHPPSRHALAWSMYVKASGWDTPVSSVRRALE